MLTMDSTAIVDEILSLHNDLKETFADLGFLNKSSKEDFIRMVLRHLDAIYETDTGGGNCSGEEIEI